VLFRVRSPAIHDLNAPKRDAEHTTPPVLAFLPLTYMSRSNHSPVFPHHPPNA
jgi:hypothetical protein